MSVEAGPRGQEFVPEPPSWRETAMQLSPEQLAAAEIVFNSKLIEGAYKSARKTMNKKDVRKISLQVSGVMQATDVIHTDGQRRARFMQDWGNESYDLLDKAKPLASEKDVIYDQAKTWEAKDRERQKMETRIRLKHLPRPVRNYIYERTDLGKETMGEFLKRERVTWGNNAVATVTSEGAAILGGAAVGALSPLEGVHDLKTLGVAIGISYAIWLRQLARTAKENLKALEETGHSASKLAQMAYRKFYSSDKWVRETMTHAGTVAYDVAAETYYWAAAGIAAFVTDGARGAAIIIGANIGAAIQNNVQVDASQYYRKEGWRGWKHLPIDAKNIAKIKWDKNVDRIKKVRAKLFGDNSENSS
jgi:hypothetical protein